jgi:flagellin
MAALSAQNNMKKVTAAQVSSNSKLSSGSRINKSADDAAGLAISEKMKSQIRSSKQASRNANDSISLIQVAEGGLNEVSSMLTRLRELSIQSASDTVGDRERSYLDKEYQQLKNEIQRISEVTEFNGKKLLSGEGEALEFQVGTMNDEFKDRISYDPSQVNATLDSLGIGEIEAGTKAGAQESLAMLDEAIQKVSENRATIGSLQNRLGVTITNLETYGENLSAANSRIRDLDFAEETAEFARLNVLQNAGTSVMAQANTMGQQALKLIG